MTINSVSIRGYRAFERFEMTNLGRVNLLVGRNNTGKSSILEALFMLASGRHLIGAWNILANRGEQLMPEPAPNRANFGEADVCHLFHGHELKDGAEFSLSTTNSPGKSITCRIGALTDEHNQQALIQFADEGIIGERLALFFSGSPAIDVPPLPLSKQGTLRAEVIQPHIINKAPGAEGAGTQFIATGSLNTQQVIQLWSSIVLTDAEDRVVQALRILDPRFERIAQVPLGMMQVPGAGIAMPSRGGFFVRLRGNPNRVPIGSFGDGTWRMLALSVALAHAKDSVLLVDEIDTGLHHTVQADMWRLINEASKAFNIQVFATTHSEDCIHALSKVCRDVGNELSEITIQRVESGKERAAAFTEAEIIAATERKIELR